jgi:hypothetical protein
MNKKELKQQEYRNKLNNFINHLNDDRELTENTFKKYLSVLTAFSKHINYDEDNININTVKSFLVKRNEFKTYILQSFFKYNLIYLQDVPLPRPKSKGIRITDKRLQKYIKEKKISEKTKRKYAKLTQKFFFTITELENIDTKDINAFIKSGRTSSERKLYYCAIKSILNFYNIKIPKKLNPVRNTKKKKKL